MEVSDWRTYTVIAKGKILKIGRSEDHIEVWLDEGYRVLITKEEVEDIFYLEPNQKEVK